MFIPPHFEPNRPREDQWHPRPITDSIESKHDLLERLEEDRKRRLRAIAGVAARTPVGLGGGNAGSAEDHHRNHHRGGRGHPHHAGSLSPKPSGAGAGAGGANDYARYRHYPPPSEESASLHASYQRGQSQTERSITTTPASVTTRRFRRGVTSRSTATPHSHGAAAAAAASPNDATAPTPRDGARTPVDGIGTATPAADRAYLEESRETTTPYARRAGRRSHRPSPASSAFRSPALNPRAGGGSSARGGGRGVFAADPMGDPSQLHIHRRSLEGSSFGSAIAIDVAAAAAIPVAAEAEDYVTPPAMASSSDQTSPGHGRGVDVYSQRRASSQRRRRRGWDEIEQSI
ncbi:hypothetical protein ACHAWF_011374 [Thalassiosira exigua]